MVVEKHTYQQPSVSGLFRQLTVDLNDLMMQHVELFRSEIKEDIERVAKYAGIAIAGAVLAFTGLIFLGFFMIFALAIVIPLWASSLVVTVLYLIIATISILVAKSHLKKVNKKSEFAVDETKRTVEEAKRWLHRLK